MKHVATKMGSNHWYAIKAEMQRREEVNQARIARQLQIEKETKERRQNRANMREQIRISNLQELITNTIIKMAPNGEWNPRIPVYDMRDYRSFSDPCIYTFGGLMGELVLCLTTINDYILAIPGNYNALNFFDIEAFIATMMGAESIFPKEAVSFQLVRDPSIRQKKNGEIETIPMSVDDLAQFALDHENIASFGLKYLIFIREQAMIGGGHTIEDIFKAVCSIHKKTIDIPEPEEGAEEGEGQQDMT